MEILMRYVRATILVLTQISVDTTLGALHVIINDAWHSDFAKTGKR